MTAPVLITHEPVLNRHRAITANRLAVHAPSLEAAADALGAVAEDWPGGRTVFLGLGDLAPDETLLEWELPENTLLELPAAAFASPGTADLARALTARGLGLCLTGYRGDIVLPPDLRFRFVLADANEETWPPSLEGVAIACGLADSAAFENATMAGYAGAAGWFFLKGGATAKTLAPSHAQIVRLMNLVRKNAEVKEIEAVLKQDVALSFKLLRYINSVGFGLSCEIQSFRHAVAILGFDKLHKWLSLLLVTSSKDPGAPALMQAAIARGRFMELVGSRYFDKSAQDNLFITGAFSLLDALLGTAMDRVLAEMHLPEAVSDALCDRGGVYQPFLELARACEQSAEEVARQAGNLGLRDEAINRAQLQALSFADSMQID